MLLCINHLTELNKELNNRVNTLESLLVKLSNNLTLDIERERELNKELDIIIDTTSMDNSNNDNSNKEKTNIDIIIDTTSMDNSCKPNNSVEEKNNNKFSILNIVPNKEKASKETITKQIKELYDSIGRYEKREDAERFANGSWYNNNKTLIEEYELQDEWEKVIQAINNIPTEKIKHTPISYDDNDEWDDEEYHYIDESSSLDKLLDKLAVATAQQQNNFSILN
jgi:hypothetical protein